MSLNDKEILGQTAKGGNIYPGIANPTVSSGTTDPVTSNFVRPYRALLDDIISFECRCKTQPRPL